MYKKEFTRDFSIIMEELWHYAIFFGFKKEFGFQSPCRQPLVFYIKEGAIEVWSDELVINKLVAQINKASRKNPERFMKILKNYQLLLKGFDKFFRVKFTKNQRTLEQFLERIYEIITSFTIMYYLAEYSAMTGRVKNYAKQLRRKDTFYEDCDRFLRQSLRVISPRLKGLETVILVDEIKALPSGPILKKRKNSFILVPGYFQGITTIEKFAKDYKTFVFSFPKLNSGVSLIKGHAVYKGQVAGRVRVIRTKDKIATFKKGEILVAPMTTPDYLPAMKKAAAFVTDEGGVLCHAAIIARELKKPCLIGTKIATQILKDGDIVEVDAEQGMVKIIKKG